MGELDRTEYTESFEFFEDPHHNFASKAESLRSEIKSVEGQIVSDLEKLQSLNDEVDRSSVVERLNLMRFKSAGQLARQASELIEAAQNYGEMEQAELLYYRATALEPSAEEIDVHHRYSN